MWFHLAAGVNRMLVAGVEGLRLKKCLAIPQNRELCGMRIVLRAVAFFFCVCVSV